MADSQCSPPSQNGETIPMSVKVGDSVVLPEYGGQTMKFDDKVRIGARMCWCCMRSHRLYKCVRAL